MARTNKDDFRDITSTNGLVIRLVKTEAARRRANDAIRASLIAELGWTSEDPADRYLASTAELTRWANEKRSADAQHPHVIVEVFNERAWGRAVPEWR